MRFKFNLFLKNILKKYFIFFFLFFIFSCQPIEDFDEIIFDNNILTKITINANKKFINEMYQISYVDPYIDHSIKNPPVLRLKNWLDQNISIFGSQNTLVINIIDASLTRTERKNNDKKKYQEVNEFFYEINFIVEYELYDDSNYIIATSTTKAIRSTTSSKFISINEKERIIDTLILDALIDISLKSEELIKAHMKQFIL